MASIKVPQITEADMLAFHNAHFLQPSTSHFTLHFLQPVDPSQPLKPPSSFSTPPATEAHPLEAEEEENYDDGLGYYPDGVKRTLTDEQIAIFRHSELERLRKERESRKIRKQTVPDMEEGELSEEEEGELSDSTPPAAAVTAPVAKKKKWKRKKRKNDNRNGDNDDEPIDLRKRTWDKVEAGLATLDYDEGEGEVMERGGEKRRRIDYGDD